MGDYIEVSAKTVEDAVTKALIQLETTSDKMEYVVVEKGSTGILGIFNSKPAIIKARKVLTVTDMVEEFLKDVFAAMNMEVTMTSSMDEEEKCLNIDLAGADMGVLIGAKSVIEKILPVIDNFERGLGTLSEEEAQTPFAEGMDKIYKQLLKTLDEMDVKPIEAVGQEFDPNFHNAVMHVEDENVGENIVVEEFQKGYLYRESVVRHSMVKVAN